MSTQVNFFNKSIRFDNPEKIINEITEQIRYDIFKRLKRRGGVVGISGGIDSSVTISLASKALGKQNVIGLILPEKDSDNDSKIFALKLADKLGIQTIEENITAALVGFGCYSRRDQAVERIFPHYNPKDFKMKIGIKQTDFSNNIPPIFTITIIDNEGNKENKRIPLNEYLQIVSASNFKQRCRMSLLYYHAERLHYAVIGTPNKHEVKQGFFVKYGDGGADLMPIGNLYKDQVYQLAEHLDIPKEIIERVPTTDTYSAEQTQEEFFFQLPYDELDLIWYGFENNYDPSVVGKILGKDEKQIEIVYNNFKRKQETTDYLRMQPILY